MRAGLIGVLLVVALSGLQVEASGRFENEPQVLVLASEEETTMKEADNQVDKLPNSTQVRPATAPKQSSTQVGHAAAAKQNSTLVGHVAANGTRVKVGKVLQHPPVKAKNAGQDVHSKAALAKELAEKTAKKDNSKQVAAEQKAQEKAAKAKSAVDAAQKTAAASELKQKKDPSHHEAKNKRSLSILNKKQALIDAAKHTKQGSPKTEDVKESADMDTGSGKDTGQSHGNGKAHLDDLKKAIESFEDNVKQTLKGTEEQLRNATVGAAYQTIEQEQEKVRKIPVNLVHDAFLQLDEKALKDKLSDLLNKKEQLLFKTYMLHKQMEAKATAKADATALKMEEMSAEKVASKDALKTEEASAHSDRKKFIKAEIDKAKQAANLKIVNPLEEKMKLLEESFHREHAWMLHDRKEIAKHLRKANQAIGKGANSGQGQFAAFTTESMHDVEAAKASSLLRYSSKHSSEVRAQYQAVKQEYDALQTALEKENQKQISKAVEKAEEKAGLAYDKVEAGHVKKVLHDATTEAKKEVDEKEEAKDGTDEAKKPCNKCVNACKTDDCSAWCKSKWCSEPEHAHFVAAREARVAKERAASFGAATQPVAAAQPK
jgi:hypothetical protein